MAIVHSTPEKLKHCKVYSSEVSATFNNPEVRKEIKEANANWTLSHSAQHRPDNKSPYTTKNDKDGYRIFYEPAQVKETLSPEWTIYECKRTKTTSFGVEGSGANNALHKNCERASYFSEHGEWSMIFNASLSVVNKDDSDIVYTSEGKDSFDVEIEGTKILVHTFEGAGAWMGFSPDSIEQAFGQTLNNDNRVIWTQHTWTGVGNVAGQIQNRHNECEGCGHYDTVVLAGHSLGGYAAMDCLKMLHNCEIQMWEKKERFCLNVALVFTIDPVWDVNIRDILLNPERFREQLCPPTGGERNFEIDSEIGGKHLNFYQRCDTNCLLGKWAIWGDSVGGAANTELEEPNLDDGEKPHIQIVHQVADTFATALQGVAVQQSSPGKLSPH